MQSLWGNRRLTGSLSAWVPARVAARVAAAVTAAILLPLPEGQAWSADAPGVRGAVRKVDDDGPDVLQPVTTLGRGDPAGSARPNPGGLATPRVAGRFRSIARNEAVLYDAPSDRSAPLYSAPAGMPVEVVSIQRDWMKIRDVQGDMAWVARPDVSDQRTLVVRTRTALQRDPRAGSGAWFELAPGVLVQPLADEPDSNGYVRARHADGTTGWIARQDVWGG